MSYPTTPEESPLPPPCNPRLPISRPEKHWETHAKEYRKLQRAGNSTPGSLLLYPIRNIKDHSPGILQVQYFADPQNYRVRSERLVCMVVEDLDGKLRRRFVAQKNPKTSKQREDENSSEKSTNRKRHQQDDGRVDCQNECQRRIKKPRVEGKRIGGVLVSLGHIVETAAVVGLFGVAVMGWSGAGLWISLYIRDG